MIINDTARITALGNGFTDKARINDFVFLKAAETASAQGFTHFAMLGSEDTSSVSSYTTPGTMQTSVYGRSAITTYSPGISSAIVKPGADVMVRFCGQDKGNPCTGMLPVE